MSIATLDPVSYQRMFAETVARYARRGYSQTDARIAAKQLLDGCFVCSDEVAQLEIQEDYTNARSNWTR